MRIDSIYLKMRSKKGLSVYLVLKFWLKSANIYTLKPVLHAKEICYQLYKLTNCDFVIRKFPLQTNLCITKCDEK